MTRVYLVRKWYHDDNNELHEVAIGVASSLDKAKKMATENRKVIGEWKVTDWGVHSIYINTPDKLEMTINQLTVDKRGG